MEDDPDAPYTLAECLREDDERWREALLLGVAKKYAGAHVWTLVDVLCGEGWPDVQPPAAPDWYAALRAAQAVLEVDGQHAISRHHRNKAERLRSRLAELMAMPEALAGAPLDRAAAGRALSALGDPRPGGGLADWQGAGEPLPAMAWVRMPGSGASLPDGFRLGDSLRADPEHQRDNEHWDRPGVEVAPYWLAAYPVTVAQYRPFVVQQGYAERRWWTEAGWKEKGDRAAPYGWDDPDRTLDNHPVVGVNWYEAVAYCCWLTARYRAAVGEAWTDLEVRLPTEAEWEWAARGPQARRWPWGDGFESRACNWEGANLNRASAVGAHPLGANWLSDVDAEGPVLGSPYALPAGAPQAVHDLAGNVWEWCLTRWQEKYSASWSAGEWSADYLKGDNLRVLRGGAFLSSEAWVRGAYRLGTHPWLGYGDWGFRCCVATSSLKDSGS